MDIESRLKKLERTNRVLIAALFGVLAATATTAVVGHVHAQGRARKIVADSIETRSLAVVNPTGKQGVKIAVGDDGMVSIGMTDVSGKGTVSLLSDPDGKPSICLAYRNVCRVVIGDVYRGDQRELSIQLRNSSGNPVWMPATPNPIATAARGGLRK